MAKHHAAAHHVRKTNIEFDQELLMRVERSSGVALGNITIGFCDECVKCDAF
jgi:hypothetical protein